MRDKSKIAVALALLAILAAAAWASSEPIKIRVKTDSAVLRLTPSPKGEIVADKIAAGTVLEAVRKAGAWFEVRHVSPLGAVITAYIHKSDVDVVGEPPAAKPAPAVRTPRAGRVPAAAGGTGLELSLGGGLAFTGAKDWSADYSYSWSYSFLQYANEAGAVSLTYKNPAGLGLSAAYFFTPRIGLKLRLDYRTAQGFENGTNTYGVEWKWTSSSNVYSRNAEWPLTGEVGAAPIIALNGVFRAVSTPQLTVAIEAGATLMPAKISANGTVGYATSWWSGLTQYFDYFAVPIRTEASSTAIGFDAGVRGEYRLSSRIGIVAEAVYTLAGKISSAWEIVPGTYPCNVNTGWQLNVTAEQAEGMADDLAPLEAKLSFFKIGAGVRIRI